MGNKLCRKDEKHFPFTLQAPKCQTRTKENSFHFFFVFASSLLFLLIYFFLFSFPLFFYSFIHSFLLSLLFFFFLLSFCFFFFLFFSHFISFHDFPTSLLHFRGAALLAPTKYERLNSPLTHPFPLTPCSLSHHKCTRFQTFGLDHQFSSWTNLIPTDGPIDRRTNRRTTSNIEWHVRN